MRRLDDLGGSSPRRFRRWRSSSPAGRQDEDQHGVREQLLDLQRALPVDLQHHVFAARQARLDRLARGAVEVAVHLRPTRRTRRVRSWRGRRARLMKQYSRPSCSWPRGARVVCETDTARCESSSSSALTRLDLPAPLGAATQNRLPGVSIVRCARRAARGPRAQRRNCKAAVYQPHPAPRYPRWR